MVGLHLYAIVDETATSSNKVCARESRKSLMFRENMLDEKYKNHSPR